MFTILKLSALPSTVTVRFGLWQKERISTVLRLPPWNSSE